jgi:cell division protein FtsI/penicillin-binding protein 2
VIGGRPVPNEGEFDLGTVPLRTAFARSCNTTFAQLGAQLPPDALPSAALRLGLGADYRVPGLTTVTGAVPPSTDTVQRAENGFGQGQVIATPLGMALAAATWRAGRTSCRSSSTAVPPRCWRRRRHPTRPRSTSSGR